MQEMACEVRNKRARISTRQNTPSSTEPSSPVDLTILDRSPRDLTEFRQANSVFNAALKSSNLPSSPTQRYAKRLTMLLESQITEMTILRKEKTMYTDLIDNRHKSNGKSIKLQGKFVLNTDEVLKIVRESEENPTEERRPRGRPRKHPIEEEEPKEARPRGRPRKHPIDEDKPKESRPRGRPRKHPIEDEKPKEARPRGRPRKNPIEEQESKNERDESEDCPHDPEL